MKQSLMRFFQGKRIKVSLFLQQSLQTVDGALVLNHQGDSLLSAVTIGTISNESDSFIEIGSFQLHHDPSFDSTSGELPFGTELPGQVRFFEDKQVTQVIEFETTARAGCTEANDVLNPKLRLGLNMYSKEASATSPTAQAKTASLSQAAALKAMTSKPGESDWRFLSER